MKRIYFAGLLLAGALVLSGCGSDVGASGAGSTIDGSSTVAAVTAEEWAEALDLSDITNYTWKSTMEAMGDIMIQQAKLDGDKAYISSSYSTAEDIEELYYSKENGMMYVYRRDEEGTSWIKDTDSSGSSDDAWEASEMSALFADEYDKFVFDRETGVYKAENINLEYMVYDEISIRIADGKIKSIAIKMTYGEMQISGEVVFSDYGTTEVVLPEIPEE